MGSSEGKHSEGTSYSPSNNAPNNSNESTNNSNESTNNSNEANQATGTGTVSEYINKTLW